jgi:hypothetical protein
MQILAKTDVASNFSESPQKELVKGVTNRNIAEGAFQWACLLGPSPASLLPSHCSMGPPLVLM